MIDCYKCYKCERIGNVLYCPFFDIQPCYRGEHKLNLALLNAQKKAEVRKIIVPRSQSVFYKHTERILKAYANEESMLKRLSKELGINNDTMRKYAYRLLYLNCMTVATLRSQKWRLVWG